MRTAHNKTYDSRWKFHFQTKFKQKCPFTWNQKKEKVQLKLFPIDLSNLKTQKVAWAPHGSHFWIKHLGVCSEPANDRNKDFHVKTSRYPIHSSLEPIYSINDYILSTFCGFQNYETGNPLIKRYLLLPTYQICQPSLSLCFQDQVSR